MVRVLEKSTDMPPVYIAEGPVWDHARNRQTKKNFAFLNIHETLHCHAAPEKTSLHEWTSCSGEQQEYKDDLYETARQLGVGEKSCLTSQLSGSGVMQANSPRNTTCFCCTSQCSQASFENDFQSPVSRSICCANADASEGAPSTLSFQS